MIKTMRERVVFFEPWSLGDVIIAAAAARELAVRRRLPVTRLGIRFCAVLSRRAQMSNSSP